MKKNQNGPIEKTDRGGEPATRARILELLKRRGVQSSAELAKALGVTPMAARLHLYQMEEEGIVQCCARGEEDAPRKRGRPVKGWELTEASARVFPDAHQGLALALLDSVEGLFGRDGMEKIIAAHGDRQRKAYRDRLDGAKTLGEKVKRLAAARDEEGYMAEARKEGGDWLLVENHCPICSAAKACRRLCANELDVFRDALGAEASVEREEHILSGARRCAYRVKPV